MAYSCNLKCPYTCGKVNIHPRTIYNQTTLNWTYIYLYIYRYIYIHTNIQQNSLDVGCELIILIDVTKQQQDSLINEEPDEKERLRPENKPERENVHHFNSPVCVFCCSLNGNQVDFEGKGLEAKVHVKLEQNHGKLTVTMPSCEIRAEGISVKFSSLLW